MVQITHLHLRGRVHKYLIIQKYIPYDENKVKSMMKLDESHDDENIRDI